MGILKSRSALGELRSATGGLQTVLLAFLHSRIAGQEARFLQLRTQLLAVILQQGASDAVTDGTGLAGDAAALDGADHVHLAEQVGGDQRLTDDQLQGVETEVVVDLAAVDNNGTGAVLINADTGDRGLAAAGASRLRASGQHGCAPDP